jgi:hypothetical protein
MSTNGTHKRSNRTSRQQEADSSQPQHLIAWPRRERFLHSPQYRLPCEEHLIDCSTCAWQATTRLHPLHFFSVSQFLTGKQSRQTKWPHLHCETDSASSSGKIRSKQSRPRDSMPGRPNHRRSSNILRSAVGLATYGTLGTRNAWLQESRIVSGYRSGRRILHVFLLLCFGSLVLVGFGSISSLCWGRRARVRSFCAFSLPARHGPGQRIVMNQSLVLTTHSMRHKRGGTCKGPAN